MRTGLMRGVSPVRLVLNLFATVIWVSVSIGLWALYMFQPASSRQQEMPWDKLAYPTILACNAIRGFNVASRSTCADEYGPWNKAGIDLPSAAENKAQKCLPVGRVVFFEPEGPRFCLKYQAPDAWTVKEDMSILKASVELLGPNGEEHFLPSEGLTLFVLSTSDWERAVTRYQKQGGNGTDFLKLFNDITQASSIAVASAQYHTNVVVHVNKWTTLGGASSLRYHLTTSSRPIQPLLLNRIKAGKYHVATLRIMFASHHVEETVEFLSFDWWHLFGISAAIAALLDILVRFVCFSLRVLIRRFSDNASSIIDDYLGEEVEMDEYGNTINDDPF